MQTTQTEVNAVKQAVETSTEACRKELSELELSLVGGGCADPAFV